MDATMFIKNSVRSKPFPALCANNMASLLMRRCLSRVHYERNCSFILNIQNVSLLYGHEDVYLKTVLLKMPFCTPCNDMASLQYECGYVCQGGPFGKNSYHILYIQTVSLQYGLENVCQGKSLWRNTCHILYIQMVFLQYG